MKNFNDYTINLYITNSLLKKINSYLDKNLFRIIGVILTTIAILSFYIYYKNGFGLSYNDARSHLDIARRVVENLKPGVAQLGSVWLPLPHVLMLPTVWIDLFWHTGLSGAIVSMISFVATGLIIYKFGQLLHLSKLAKIIAVGIFALNLNVLYLQSTAMTELLLLATMTGGVYYLALWTKSDKIIDLVKSAFWIMASTLTRYDGWFLLACATFLVGFTKIRKKGMMEAEGHIFLFATLAGIGIILWLLWNQLIFNDPLYFAYGPYSAHAQQSQLLEAGELPTKGELFLSLKTYTYAVMYNSYTFPAVVGFVGLIYMLIDRNIRSNTRYALAALLAPFAFNVLALFLGHSVLFLPEVIGETWFNARYGMMLLPSFAIAFGYVFEKSKTFRWPLVGIFLMISTFAIANQDAVTIDDAVYGASQKNVSEVAGWLTENAYKKEGYVLISAASHDAIIFSSGLPMKRFIHEGTGAYWDYAVENPDKWATWIIVRTHDMNDSTFREINDAEGFKKFNLVNSYPFADIYELKSEFRKDVITKPILGRLK